MFHIHELSENVIEGTPAAGFAAKNIECLHDEAL